MHYIEQHIQSLCHHSTVLMTSQPLHMKPHPVCTATYTLCKKHHRHYLCPHTQSIDNITPTLCMTSHSHMCGIFCPIQVITSSFYDIKPPCLCHHSQYIWHRVHCVWMCHHIHCIDDITPTVLLRSHPR